MLARSGLPPWIGAAPGRWGADTLTYWLPQVPGSQRIYRPIAGGNIAGTSLSPYRQDGLTVQVNERKHWPWHAVMVVHLVRPGTPSSLDGPGSSPGRVASRERTSVGIGLWW